MSQEKRAKRIIIAVLVWLVIMVVLGVVYKRVVPHRPGGSGARGSEQRGQSEGVITVAHDPFSGYCILRSSEMQDRLKAKGIRLDFQDDNADYVARMKALQAGKVQMAVFTVDSFIATGAGSGDYPAVIVMVIDETQGADGIVTYSEAVSNVKDLNYPEARFVLTPDSPSEFLARTVIAQFNLTNMPKEWSIKADGAEDVCKKFRTAKRSEKRAYVLWEPFLSEACALDGARILIDSSMFKGYIVDVLVAERQFLATHQQEVAAVVETYLRTSYFYHSKTGGMTELVLADAKAANVKMSSEQADKVVKGIHWKNTPENYEHFCSQPGKATAGIDHIEDIITKVTEVLVKTGKLQKDPLRDRVSSVYDARILSDLKAGNFDAGQTLNVLKVKDIPSTKREEVVKTTELAALSAAEWKGLSTVGEMRVKPIAFGRATADLNVQSERELAELAKRLESMPNYYMRVVGHTRIEGDREANQRLAQERADAATKALIDHGLQKNRAHATTTEPSAQQEESGQSVTFEVGLPPKK